MYVIYREMILKAVLITVCVSLLNHECNIYFWIVFFNFLVVEPYQSEKLPYFKFYQGMQG